MRGVLLSLAILFALGVAAPQAAPLAATTGSSIVAPVIALQDAPPKDVNVDINLNRSGGGWYRSPVWIAIGAVAAVVVLLLIVLVARGGGGTTIVRE